MDHLEDIYRRMHDQTVETHITALRDHLAALAMRELVGAGGWKPDELAGRAYAIADAMLAERGRKPPDR